MFRWKDSSFCRLVAQVLVFLMVVQGLPFWELSQHYKWYPEKFHANLSRFISFFGPTEAHADESVPGTGGQPCLNLSARSKRGKVQLTWTHKDGTQRYDVYRADELAPSNFVKIGETTSTYSTYLDSTVENGNTYLYVVGALSQGTTCYSDIISIHLAPRGSPDNFPPVIYSSPITDATAGVIYTYDVDATDPNGDDLTYSIIDHPDGITIDAVTGLIQWTPTNDHVGDHDVTARVQDTAGLFDTQSFTVSVAFSGPTIVSVPDVVSQAQADAEAAIIAAGLTVGTVTTANSDTVPAGSVISQDPVGGTSVAEGSPVDLIISLGPVMVTVPDVVGQTQADAEAAILAANLTVGTITTANSASVLAGDVISQNPAGGTSVVQGSPVNIVISLGPVMVLVPDVVGQPQADAEATILSAILIVGTVTTANSATVLAGSVISQNPVAGASVAEGSAVDLVVSLGPVMATVPDVVGQLQANAEAAVLAAGLVVGAITTANSDTVPAGNVISQDPAGGSSVVEGSAVDLVISLGPAVIEDYTRPEVSVTIVPTVANVGESVTITVNAADNAGVVSQELLVNGVSISLDASGIATYSSLVPGVFTTVATALDASGNEGLDSEEFRFLTPGDTTPPTVAISSPVDEAKLSVPTDIIGTASDDTNLTCYKLEYSVKGKNEFITFANGTLPVTDDVLGQIDPTMMRNGLYDVRLTAEDASGNTASVTRTYQLEGEMKVGNFAISFNDLTIPVAGIPITIIRSYDSRVKTKGDFGVGWTMNLKTVEVQENRIPGEGWELYCTSSIFGLCLAYGVRPTESHTVLVSFPNGRDHEFNVRAVTSFALANLVQGHFTFDAQSGTFSTLEALDNKTYNWLMGGELLDFDFDIVDPNRYRLADVNGTVFVCNQSSGLEQITDPNGNTITFTTGGIIHSAGKSVTFTRDTQGRITAITDPMSNTIQFVYDFYGDLVSVTDQEGNTTEFTYNSSHGLVDIIDPRGIRPARNEYDDEGRLVAIIDANGNRVECTHNVGTRQEVVKDRSGNVTVYEYDDDGNVISQTDTLGNTTDYTYDDRGNKLTETDPLGNTTSHTYDAQGNMLTQTDPLGNTATYTYNSRNQILTTTDPLGNTTTNSYDAKGNFLTTADSLGNTTTNTYDASGNLLLTTDCMGNVTSFEYDGHGNLTKQNDSLGNEPTYTYDANGNQLTQTTSRTTDIGLVTMTTANEYDGLNRLIKTIDPDGNVTITEYNAIGKQSATVNKNGNRIEYNYDLMGNLIKTTYSDSTTETATYDANGNKLVSTDRGGRTTQYEYDPLNRLIMTTFPDGSSTSSEYDAGKKVIAIIDENGNRTSYEYDAAGRRTRVTDALGNVITFAYDGNGNQASMTDANGNSYNYEYDALNRRIRTIFPDGSFTTIGYDSLGRKISETDLAGITTVFAYDALGRLISVTDALGQITTYTYDEVGNKITQADANGNTTAWTYDNLGRFTQRTLPLGMSETMAYDASGNLVSNMDFNSDTTTYTCDSNNRVTQKTYQDGSSVSFTYTPTGQMATVLDSRGLTSFTYDQRDRLLQRTDPDGISISYTYDAVGNRTSVTVPSGTTTHTFDELNRLETVTDPEGGVTTYTYDTVGNRASVAYPNGTKAFYTYDALNRLIILVNQRSDTSIISSYTYTLGLAGNRTRVEENTGRIVDYTYDALYRIVQENITDAVLGNETISYTYDPVGNRLTKTDSSRTTNYTYDANDRLLTEGGNIYTYDDNGNTLRKSDGVHSTTYDYDYENRLASAQTPSSLIDYEYDANGIRVRSIVDGVVTDYLVDKNRDYAQVLEERDDVGTLVVSYLYGDDLISQNRSSQMSYYMYDGQGSTRQMADPLEATTDTYVFDAFGIELDRTGTTENNYLYTGEQYDPNVGFYYLRARYYNSSIGRFLSFDSYQGNQFDPISLHKYLYANGDPIDNTDPTGKFTLIQALTAVTIMTILSNIAISSWAFHTAAKCNFRIDGILLSARFDISHIIAGGGGIDLLLDLRSSNFFVSLAAELGLDPLSTFKKHRGGGFTVVAGLVFGLSSPNLLSGFGVSALWPTSVLRLMPIIGGTSNVWGAMTQFAKNVIHHKGATVGFGRSFSGPAIMFFGTSYRSFSSMITWNTNFTEIGEVPSTIEGYVDQLKGIASALASLGRDMSSFAKNADGALSLLP